MTADNFHIDMTGVSIELALKVAFSGKKQAVGWAEFPANPKLLVDLTQKRLVLFWYKDESMTSFPAPLDEAGVFSLVNSWLSAQDYGPQPDHDGDNGKGCRVYNEAWGHVASKHGAFVAIEPAWLMYGK